MNTLKDPLHVFEKPPGDGVASDPGVGGDVEYPQWHHHHPHSPQFDKLRGRIEEAKKQHSVGGGGAAPPRQGQAGKMIGLLFMP